MELSAAPRATLLLEEDPISRATLELELLEEEPSLTWEPVDLEEELLATLPELLWLVPLELLWLVPLPTWELRELEDEEEELLATLPELLWLLLPELL